MYWPEEDCVSVVPFRMIVEPCPPVLDKPCLVQTSKNTFTGVTVMVGSKRRMTEVESNFIDGSFQIQKQQSEGVEAGEENVAISGPNPKASKKSSVSKTGKKRRVPLADVNGSNEDQENGEANAAAKKKSKTRRKENAQAVQELTGIILDEAAHDTTLTDALEVKHITAIVDIAKRLEDRLKAMQKATEERMRSMEYAMTNMQNDLTDLKDHLQKISSVHSADMEHQNPQPYSETIPLDDSFWEEQLAAIPPGPPRVANAVQPAAIPHPMIDAVQPAAIPRPMTDAVQPAAIPRPMIDAVQPAAIPHPMIDAVQPAAIPHPMTDAVQPSFFPSTILADAMQQHSPPFVPRTIPCINPRYSEMSSEEIARSGLKSIPEVLLKYPDLQSECKIGKLAVKLAREAVFGDAVLRRYTPKGWQDMPALPQRELNMLKTALYKNLPRYWSCPEAFEKKWTIAQEAIAQACKRLRSK